MAGKSGFEYLRCDCIFYRLMKGCVRFFLAWSGTSRKQKLPCCISRRHEHAFFNRILKNEWATNSYLGCGKNPTLL